MKRLKQLEKENKKAEKACCRFVAGQVDPAGPSSQKSIRWIDFYSASYQAKTLRPARRRELVDDLRTAWNVCIRRACRVLCAPRSSHRYRLCGDHQAELKKRIKETTATRVRYVYRRIHVLLRRESWEVNLKRSIVSTERCSATAEQDTKTAGESQTA